MKDGTLDKIPQSKEMSEGEMIFRAWRSKQISDADYFLMSAQYTFALLNQEKVLRYPAMESQMLGYVNSRLSGGDFNRFEGTKLGAWIEFVSRQINENTKNQEHLVWCLEKVSEKNMTAEMEAFTKKLSEHERNRVPTIFENALLVQKRDAISREMERKAV